MSRAHIVISNHYFRDAIDLCKRFNHCFHHDEVDFVSLKSRRFKLFIDLRLALESTLKAIVLYFCHPNLNDEELVKKAVKYSHSISKLIDAALPHVPEEMKDWCSTISPVMSKLPVSLRYSLDSTDFRYADEELYYQTVGSDVWLEELEKSTTSLTEYIGACLSKESRIVSIADIAEELKKPAFNSYLKRNV